MKSEPDDLPEVYYYGIYESLHYGTLKRNYSMIVKCTLKQAEEITDSMNYHHGRLFDGRLSGSIGTERFYVLERVSRIFESYEEFCDFVEKGKQAMRERMVTEGVWSCL
jgi:hypothetical protein